MPLTAEDVRNKEFSTTKLGRRGYDEKEVDDFLLEIQAELERLGRENAQLTHKLAVAERSATGAALPGGDGAATAVPPVIPTRSTPTRLAPATGTSDVVEGASSGSEPASASAARILELAQRTADEHVSEAQAQAEQLLSSAQARAERLSREADERQRRILGETEEQRTALERQVEGLRAFEREYRSRLTAYLESQLAELAGRAGEAPSAGSALAADGARLPGGPDDSIRFDGSSADGASAGGSHDPPRE